MWKKTAILAAVLGVLSTVVYWHEFSLKPKQEDAEESKKMPFALKEQAVSEIQITDGKSSFTFKCLDTDKKLCKAGDSSKWQIISPETHTGDESNINALLSGIVNLSAPEMISLKDESPETKTRLLKEYGVSPSDRSSTESKKVTVTLASGGKQILYLGNIHPIGESFFSLSVKSSLDENTVFLVPSHFKANFEHDLAYWRNKKIFPVQTFEVVQFNLKSKKGSISGDRKNGLWTLNSEFSGDIENIDNFLTSTMNVTAKDFLPKSAIPLSAPLVELTIKKDATQSITAKLYKIKKINSKTKKEEDRSILTLTGADPVYEIDGMQFEKMNLGLKDLRFSKLISSTDRFELKQIKFTGGNLGKDGLTAIKTDDKWSVFEVKTQAIQDSINKILERLSGNRVQEFIAETKKPGTGDSSLEIEFFNDAKQPPVRKLLVWKSKNTLYARDLNSKRPETFKLDNLLDDALPWKKETLIK
ncbi:MAG: DUF4340 domain-containing protein [Xanthomonadaceae bacterium]|nr:DUF4340 domain-containing protein [Xanthomonadaceae bacterium]